MDAFAYYSHRNIPKPPLRSLYGEEDTSELSSPMKVLDADDSDATSDDSEAFFENNELKVVVTKANDMPRNEKFPAMTDEHYLLAFPWVKGMDLETKEWSESMKHLLC